jgi:ketopantoate hydroxymethyltransferase
MCGSSGIDSIGVGHSLGRVVLGKKSTVSVTMEKMLELEMHLLNERN